MSEFCSRTEDTIAHVREFLARNRKLFHQPTLVGRIAAQVHRNTWGCERAFIE